MIMVRFETPYNKHDVPPHHGQAETKSGSSEGAPTGARKWNSWWSRRSSNIITNENAPVALGIDAGSKTIKLVAIDERGQIVFGMYHRHRSDVLTTLAELLHDAVWRYGDMNLPVAITGSAGIALAKVLGVPFVQEVVATTNAVKQRYPDADCIIELGGEDAKITYLTGNVEQRMNATCAGGTGDFIDGIAGMLGERTRNISKLALGSQRTYPIASRCAVFAQTDVRPLINAGVRKADIAQSTLDAVARQTLGGLACGRPITGKVVFLGGPFEHIPALVMTFRKKLGLSREDSIKPPDAHLFAAMGAVLSLEDAQAIALSELERRVRASRIDDGDAQRLSPLFENEEELAEFQARHSRARLKRKRIDEVKGPLFLGFDAGSTTIKYALVDESGALVASDYRDVQGDTVKEARLMLEELLLMLEGDAYTHARHHIAHATVTGYGEDLLKAGFGFDSGVVETVAHLRAARQFQPDVSFVLDIGGQDMKALWIQDGQVTDAVLNEACSSGCGAFVQSSARSLGLKPAEFSRIALDARKPLDLGAKCTVFMTSRVRHAQKAGADKGDIAAGIAYSVVNNVMTRIIGKNHTAPLGDSIVVQGGAFKSDAVLRAFEKAVGAGVVRPDCAHLMGAYGAALVALDEGGTRSSLLSLEELRELDPKRTSARCPGCDNACLLSIVDFGNGARFVSGNRCERAYEALFGERVEHLHKAPNVVALSQKLMASYSDFEASGERGSVTVGFMNVLNAYGTMPFWHALFTTLGFSVIVPDEDGVARVADKAAETIPSESVCHPAKIAHARYAYLVEAGADFVFMPQFERGTRCPVATGYANALQDNVGADHLISPKLKSLKARAIVQREEDRASLREAIGAMMPEGGWLEEGEFDRALGRAVAEQDGFEQAIVQATEKALAWAAADDRRRVAVLADRPYHADPTLIHRIDALLAQLGFATVPMSGLDEQLSSVSAQKGLWKPSKHLLKLVEYASSNPQMEVVVLRSFGCGYDAVSTDEARDLATVLGRPFTELKIDDIANTAHIRIRLRTLAYTCGLGGSAHICDSDSTGRQDRGIPELSPPSSSSPTPDLCSTAKALVDRAMLELEEDPGVQQLELPIACLDCLTDSLPFELDHLGVKGIEVSTVANNQVLANKDDGRPKAGLLGNPLIVYNPDLNDGVAQLVEQLGWQLVYPEPDLIEVEDVRYLAQLERFHEQGVERIIYLQSFGCLKGHVQSRGALHDLAARFPDMPITIIDYDPESSALNRENRIRLALAKS